MCGHGVGKRLLAVPGPADGQQDDLAVVWRESSRVDHLHALFSSLSAGRLPVCSSVGPAAADAMAGDCARHAADRGGGAVADRTGPSLEASR